MGTQYDVVEVMRWAQAMLQIRRADGPCASNQQVAHFVLDQGGKILAENIMGSAEPDARTAALVAAARKVSVAVFSSNANDWIAAVDELNAALQPFERAAGEGEKNDG